RNDDYNGATQEGFGLLQSTIRAGKRSSTSDGYLNPIENRSNLTVWTHTLATRILFDGTRAIGVAYRTEDGEQQVQAEQEVIISGGAINSPQLLMLSGIGRPIFSSLWTFMSWLISLALAGTFRTIQTS